MALVLAREAANGDLLQAKKSDTKESLGRCGGIITWKKDAPSHQINIPRLQINCMKKKKQNKPSNIKSEKSTHSWQLSRA